MYFEYNPRSQPTAITYPSSAGVSFLDYDNLSRVIKVTSPSGSGAYFTYDAASNPTLKILGNGARLEMTYDAAERTSRWRSSTKALGALTYFDYTRDAKGLITKVVREVATDVVYYEYDSCDRLLTEIWRKSGVAEMYAFRYAYDPAGNRLRALIKNGTTTDKTYYFYDRGNQLTVRGTDAIYATPTYYFYDKNGSVTAIKEPTRASYFAYNAAGVVARIRWGDTSSTYFLYDGNLQRYAVQQGTTSLTTTYFLWDGMNLLQELNADGTVKEEHTNYQSPIAGIGQLLETNRPGQAQAKLYPIMDPRGTITKWMQSDGNAVFASREYDAFGNLIFASSTGTWPGRQGYQGQAWQELLSSNGQQRVLISPTRIYDPVTGRFLQNEVLLDRRAISQFIYVKQQPCSHVDPTGLESWGTSIKQGFKRFGKKLLSFIEQPAYAVNDVIVATTVAGVNAWDRIVNDGKNQIYLDDVPFAGNAAQGTKARILSGIDTFSAIDSAEADYLWNLITFGGVSAYNDYQAYMRGEIDENELRRRWLEVPEDILLAAIAARANRFRMPAETKPCPPPKPRVVVDLGGEGTATANVQPGKVWPKSEIPVETRLNEAQGIAKRIKEKSGSPVVRAYGDQLPFKTNSADVVVTDSVPVGNNKLGLLGPDFSPSEIQRIMKPDGLWVGNSSPSGIGRIPISMGATLGKPPGLFPWIPYPPSDRR